MLPALVAPYAAPHLEKAASWLFEKGITFGLLTLASVLSSVLVMAMIGLQLYPVAIFALLLNRACDAFDGPVAELQRKAGNPPSSFSAFADTMADIFLYAGVVFAFVLGAPEFALAGTFLLFTWMLSGFATLAFQIEAAAKGLDEETRSRPALLMLDGVASGTEMTLAIILMCVVPAYFPAIALLYGIICLVTTGSRVVTAYKTLR